MNLYSRVQRAIDYMEHNLSRDVDISEAAKNAYMSRAGLYRLFQAFTGYSAKEYVRRRRISNACADIENGVAIVDAALRNGYSSQEALTKPFHAIVGTTPGSYRDGLQAFNFVKINLLEECFEVQEDTLKEKYPEISVLTKLPKMRVASYQMWSEEPEGDGWPIIMDWVMEKKLLNPDKGSRIFGFDFPAYFASERGYEWWISVPWDFQFDADDIVSEKIIPEAMYALITIEYEKENLESFFQALFTAKKRFAQWCRESHHGFGFHQYMEELLVESKEGKMNLYFPISNDAGNKEPTVMALPGFTGAVFQTDGETPDGYDRAWKMYMEWAEISGDFGAHKIITIQNELNKSWGASGEIWVTNPPAGADVSGVDIQRFAGGNFMRFKTEYTSLNSELEENCYQLYQQSSYKKANGPLLIEYSGMTDEWNKRTLTCLYYPIE